jgi:16S rRNA (guanine527-N7)-methyltransferase
MTADIVKKYFPNLSEKQLEQFKLLFPLYTEWNEKINVISRKDIDHVMLHHVLHSLAIAKIIDFRPGTEILDVGTGGGFPGIPLAILFPECQFYWSTALGKKSK